MTRLSALLSSICMLILIWHECGENPAVFCYLIGKDAFRSVRARALAVVPISSETPAAMNTLAKQRTYPACSTLYSTSSPRSIIPRD